jgi:hypothetical protein
VTDYYIAYVVPDLTAEPTPEQAALLLNTTKDFWTKFFEAKYATGDIKFQGLELTIKMALYEDASPLPADKDRFNYYINFDTVVLYDLGSATPLGPKETFEIMADADFTMYILDYVRKQPAFVSNNEVEFEATATLKPATPARSGTSTKEATPEESSLPVALISTISAAGLVSVLIALTLFSRKRQAHQDEMQKVVMEASSSTDDTTCDLSSRNTFNSVLSQSVLQRQHLSI